MSEQISLDEAVRILAKEQEKMDRQREYEAARKCIELRRELKPNGFGVGADQPQLYRRRQAKWLVRELPGITYEEAADKKLKPSTLLDWLLDIKEHREEKQATGQNETPPENNPLETDADRAIMDIAKDDALSLEEKGPRILAISAAAATWKSPNWATLLGVTDGRIRGLTWWKKLQAAKRKSD